MAERTKQYLNNMLIFLRWVLYACLIGVVVGTVAALFLLGINWVTQIRSHHPDLIWLLPLAGITIVLLYRVCGMEKDRGTSLVLAAVREVEPLRLRTAPLIFFSTILTHLVGGSAGREGAALQLGGSMGAYIGKKFYLDEKDHRLMVMCGMAAAFSALFGTPLTAAVFSMEVISVGVMYYAAIVPCMLSALVGLQISHLFGLHLNCNYSIFHIPALSASSMLQVIVLGILCALLSILFCNSMHITARLYQKYLPNPTLRAAVGGALVLALTLMVGNQNYNGTGDVLIHRMLEGEIIPLAFLLKMLFTALTLGAGFRGGEIVPALCTGTAFGATISPWLGLSTSFGGALGMIAVFCGVTNCPLSSILMSYELFGGEGLALYGLCCAVSYMLSGYYGLYNEQKIVYSKFRAEWIDKKAD